MEGLQKRLKNEVGKRTYIRMSLELLLIALMGIVVHYIIYYTGGTNTAFAQLNVFVILMASYYLPMRATLLVALALAIATGPIMPLNVSLQLMQEPASYIFRTAFYLFVAVLSRSRLDIIDRKNQALLEKETISSYTGLFNTHKLIRQLDHKIQNKQDLQMLYFKITTLDEISKYIDYHVVEEAIGEWVDRLKRQFPDALKYSTNIDEFVVLVEDKKKQDLSKAALELIQSFEVVLIKGYKLKLVIKSGIVCDHEENEDAIHFLNRVKIAADQGSEWESGVYIYDLKFEKNKKFELEIANGISNSIAKEEFYLVYQPIIDIQQKRIAGAEVLMRWDRGNKESVSPDVFIDIAEKVGLIEEISKYLIRKNIQQINEWKRMGFEIPTTLNLTANELINSAFIQWWYEIVEKNKIDRSNKGIELTERMIMKDLSKSQLILSDLQKRGYTIYIDDFGTGYNSMLNMVTIPYDVIKIDKAFIDSIEEADMKALIGNIIDAVHIRGKLVVAEGVETKAQYDILQELGCDKIQGYYFSKPLLPDDFIAYYHGFHKGLCQ